jgi:hypothetical protein
VSGDGSVEVMWHNDNTPGRYEALLRLIFGNLSDASGTISGDPGTMICPVTNTTARVSSEERHEDGGNLRASQH